MGKKEKGVVKACDILALMGNGERKSRKPKVEGVKISDRVINDFPELVASRESNGRLVLSCRKGLDNESYCGPGHDMCVRTEQRKGRWEVSVFGGTLVAKSCYGCEKEIQQRRTRESPRRYWWQ